MSEILAALREKQRICKANGHDWSAWEYEKIADSWEEDKQRIKELEAIINKAKVDPNAEQLGERLIDNSYTGQIAQLKQQLDAVRSAISQFCITRPSADQMLIWQQNFKALGEK